MKIYENPEELLSISLGSAETTLLNLTSAYCTFANGGKLIEPILIDRIQDSEGNTIFNSEKRICKQCEEISYLGNKFPEISDNFTKIFSSQTAYQIVSMLEGVIKRGTGKKLRKLNLDIAGKTGTTNKNTDAWFIGFTSNLVIGVYVGFDNPESLGRYETGSKAALPIFKEFIKNSLFKEDFKEFEIPEGIYLTSLNYDTGLKASFGEKGTIIEALKARDINNINNNELISINSYDKLIKYRQFY